MPRQDTGVEGFDEMVQGGLPEGSSVLLQGPPGQEKFRFALTFLAEGLKTGACGLVLISSHSPDSVLEELRNLGVKVDAVTKENRLRIVDWYSWSEESVHEVEERGPILRSSIDLTNLGVALSRAIVSLAEGRPRRAVLEILSPATNVYEVSQVYAFAQSAKRKFDRHRFTSLVLLEKEMHPSAELTTLHQPFDGVIEIERSRSGDAIVRKIGVLHLKDTAADPSFRILELTEAGLRVVRELPKPPPSVRPEGGSVLESQTERATRLRLITQIASERIKLNPRDADALFALAAAQATLDDAKSGAQTLERLAVIDPNYPGLWVLKTKLHARLGQADLARQSRLRAELAEHEVAQVAGPTVPCPLCDAPVAADATRCESCGVKFAPTQKLEEDLDDLGHAAIQEMVQEELGTVPKPASAPTVASKSEPNVGSKAIPKRAAKPAAKPSPARGLTNGLLRQIGAPRKGGRASGRKGRTNGLPGRTNGLTNGRGRTNGLTNGLGRTNGLTNGLGRTNGLTNGLGRPSSLTNGLGRTNGLTNGLAGVRSTAFRARSIRVSVRNAGWKLYLIPLVSVALLLVPLFYPPNDNGSLHPIRIDGQFGDWASEPTDAMGPGPVSNPNVDVVRFGVVNNLGPYAFYVQVAGSALAGGGSPPGTMDTVRFFLDIDSSAASGYRIDGLGADRMIEISGYGGTVRSSTLWEFDSNRDQRDWNGWIKGTSTPAAVSGSQIEAAAQWISTADPSLPIIATVHTESWDAQSDAGDFPVSPTAGTLSVVADPQVPDVLSGTSVPLLRLTLTAQGQAVSLDSLDVQIAGTAPPSAALSLRILDGGNLVAASVPTFRDVTFSFPAIQVGVGATKTLSIVGDFSGTGGDTFGIRLPSTHPFGFGAAVVALREDPGARTLGYLGGVPPSPRVDGAFDEWTAPSSDPLNDVTSQANPAIDIGQYGARHNGTSTFLYTDVSGRILLGTPVPEAPKPTPTQNTTAPADTDRDTVPDSIDPYPFDFNNDGIPDAQTNCDVDGDGITDYGCPGGTDSWLNTTLPSSFPAPYAGRLVSVYIGPTEKPVVAGEDVLRIFLDIDNNTASGYLIGGIGADRLVEIRGKDGGVTQSALLAFAGSFPGQWAWTPVAPVTVALGYHAIELSVPFNATKVVVEAGDFWGSVDSTLSALALAPPMSSFKVATANAPLSVPWTQVGPQPTATLIDPNSGSATTVYNQQRKVVRAGSAAGAACDATNSGGCWYAVFYDRFSESGGTIDVWLHPDGPGTYANAWSGYSGGGSGCDPSHHWLCVNDDPPTGTAIIGNSASQKEDFTMENVSISPGFTNIDVTWMARCAKSSSGPGGEISHLVRTVDGTPREDVGPDKEFACPSGTWSNFTYFMATAPGGAEWTAANIDNLQCGVVSSTDPAPSPEVDQVRCRVQVTNVNVDWDRVILMRSQDTSGSTWGTPIILASGRSADSPLLYSYDSAEPSIAMDSGGFFHVVWVSASATGNQITFNMVRYTKTTVAYPSQAQLASAANWQAVANVDDTYSGYMPTISTDTGNNPHIAWSSSKTSGPVYYKNKAGGTWRATALWWQSAHYTGISVDVSPQNNYVSLVRYHEETNEIQYMVCKDLATSNCDTTTKFTRWDGTSGYDTVDSAVLVQSITQTSFATASTTHNVQMPATVNAGDLLICFIATPGIPNFTNPSGWTWFFGWNGFTNLMKFSMWAKKATGTEGGTTVNFQTDLTEKGAAQVYRIIGWRDSGTITNDIEWANAGATSANPNAPSLNPTNWGVENTLWIAAYGANGHDNVTVYPTNYQGRTYTQSDASSPSASMGSGWRGAAQASEDPTAFTIAASEEWIASTVAVRPAVIPSAAPRFASLATTWDANGDLWVSYARDINVTSRAIYARFLDYPSAGWASAETVDSLSGTVFVRPSIGVDKINNVYALYVASATPQLYYKSRTGGTWGNRTAVGTLSDNPTILLRAPNDATYGSDTGGLYWKTSTSETYFYFVGIPEFGEVVVPILGAVFVVVVFGVRRRSRVRSSRLGFWC